MRSGKMIVATVLLVLAMGSTDRHSAGVFYWLMPLMVLFAVGLIIDAADATRHGMPGHQPDVACRQCRRRARELHERLDQAQP